MAVGDRQWRQNHPLREKPRGPKAQKALRFAIRRRTLQQDRFADKGGLQDNERKQFRRVVNRRYNRLANRQLPKSDMKDIYRKRLKFLRLPEKQQNKIRQDRRERRDIRQYLGSDEVYQTQKDMLGKGLKDYLLSYQDQKGRVKEDFGLATDRMAEERTKGRQMMTEDFGARGILNSGEFLKDLGEYDEAYTQRLGDLSRDKTRSLQDLMEQRRLFRSENQTQLQLARQEAIRRRAAQQGIGLSYPRKRRRK